MIPTSRRKFLGALLGALPFFCLFRRVALESRPEFPPIAFVDEPRWRSLPE
jgi:hypothetical protein